MKAYSSNKTLEKVYAAETDNERREAYNEWAETYDKDVTEFGIQLPYVGACVFAKYVDMKSGPILDAACGTGMHTLPLKMMGYSGFHGIDISEGMLAIARERNIYDSLARMVLGQSLDFPDDHFETAYIIGALAPGNAPAESLDELLRVVKPGGQIILSAHVQNNERTKPYHDKNRQLVEAGALESVYVTEPFVSMPNGDAAIQHVVRVYKVL